MSLVIEVDVDDWVAVTETLTLCRGGPIPGLPRVRVEDVGDAFPPAICWPDRVACAYRTTAGLALLRPSRWDDPMAFGEATDVLDELAVREWAVSGVVASVRYSSLLCITAV